MSTFVGFTPENIGLKLYDADLIKQDLLNEIYTRQGERVMDPLFGSIVWDLLFEFKTVSIRNDIEADMRRIVARDSRLQLQEILIIESEHGYTVSMTILILPLNQLEQFELQFSQQLNAYQQQGQ